MAGGGGPKPESWGILGPAWRRGGLGVTVDEYVEVEAKADPIPCPQFPLSIKLFTTTANACWVLKWQKGLY